MPDLEKPPVGRNAVLNVSQIRYCMTEKIRITAFESVINNSYEHEVDRFNALVNDYNSRCGEFRYRRGDVERVQRELDLFRESITSAAKSDWVRGSLGLQSPSRTPAAKAVPAPQKAKQEQEASSGDDRSSQDRVQMAPAPRVKSNYSIPPNAKVDVYGTGWECERGFRRSGNECLEVKVPANATLDIYGHDWECERGFKRSRNECVAVRVPDNAKIDVYGHDWECERGYRRVGNECPPVKIPANAKLDVYGHDWECERGYRRAGNECLEVQVPVNAKLDVYGHGWECERGYRRVGNACLPL